MLGYVNQRIRKNTGIKKWKFEPIQKIHEKGHNFQSFN